MIKFNLSESAPNVLLRGKEVEAVFEVQTVNKLNLPEVNEEFLSKLGFATEDDYRGFLKAQLESQMIYQQEQIARETITAELLKDADWELPPALLERIQPIGNGAGAGAKRLLLERDALRRAEMGIDTAANIETRPEIKPEIVDVIPSDPKPAKQPAKEPIKEPAQPVAQPAQPVTPPEQPDNQGGEQP